MSSRRQTMVDLKQSSMELGGSGPQERDWKGIATALLVIMVICSIIFLAGYIFTPISSNDVTANSPISFSDLVKLRYPYYGVDWLNSDSILFETSEGNANIYNIHNKSQSCAMERTGNLRSRIIFSRELRYYASADPAPNPSLNPDNETAFYSITNINTQAQYKVGESNKDDERLWTFLWNPAGFDYVFVKDGHIFYSSSPEAQSTIRVSETFESGPNVHGYFDWMYEEEIFSSRTAMWWSPSGARLAFASRIDAHVKTVVMTRYTSAQKYPIMSNLEYPKTGEKRLPSYTISIWDKKARTSKQMDVQLRDSREFHYVFSVNWMILDQQEVAVVFWTNRYQNHLSVTICEYDTGLCSLVAEFKYPDKTWASPEDFNTMLHHNNSFFILLPKLVKADQYFQHIAKFTIEHDSANPSIRWARPVFLPVGEFDVSSLTNYDSDYNTIYFISHAPSPADQHMFVTKASPATSEEAACITCSFANCSYQQSRVSPDFKNVMVQCQGPSMKVWVASLKRSATPEDVLLLNPYEVLENKEHEEAVEKFKMPIQIDDKFDMGNGYEVLTRLTIPAGQLNKSHSRSLPLLVVVYGGPSTQSIKNQLSFSRQTMWAHNGQMAILQVDGRGSGSRGWKYRSAIYGALGTVEIEDQIEATKKILSKYPFLDSNRVGVFGWSYGGFSAANMVIRSPESFFKCAISGAPVSNFIYYDAAYTERYMGDAGKEAYSQSDITRDVSNFAKTRLLLIHGLFDDNVHFQNSALLIEKLQIAKIDFDLMVYPNQDHSIIARDDHKSLKIETFLNNCFSTS
ncbi:unnamed protein product [Auanema sp. JU1783]|nr:unnamed protein product [Auanema sp. JU1783]